MDNNITQPTVTPNVGNNEGAKVEKTFSQDEVNILVGNTRKEEREKNQKAIEDAVAIAIAEEQRKAKLTEEERAKESQAKYERELKAREEEITLRERKIQAQTLLAEKKIPLELVDFVINADEKVMNENIEKLTKTFNTSVEAGITDKLKGNPPKDFSNSNQEDNDKKPIITSF
jgi:hypothetical protein